MPSKMDANGNVRRKILRLYMRSTTAQPQRLLIPNSHKYAVRGAYSCGFAGCHGAFRAAMRGVREAVSARPRKRLTASELQDGVVLHCNIGHFAVRNGLYCTAKWPILQNAPGGSAPRDGFSGLFRGVFSREKARAGILYLCSNECPQFSKWVFIGNGPRPLPLTPAPAAAPSTPVRAVSFCLIYGD